MERTRSRVPRWSVSLPLQALSTKANIRSGAPRPAERFVRFAHEFFVDVRAIRLCRIEEGDAAFHGRAQESSHLLLVLGRAVRKAHAHAAQPEGGNFQVAISKFAFLHCFSFEVVSQLMYQPFWSASKSRRCRSSRRRRCG